jgi:hypothetical protein
MFTGPAVSEAYGRGSLQSLKPTGEALRPVHGTMQSWTKPLHHLYCLRRPAMSVAFPSAYLSE